MSVRAAPLNTAAADLGTAIAEVSPEAAALAEGNSFTTQSSETPLTRNIVVSIRASLNDLCLQKAKATWSPSPEALKSICKTRASNRCLFPFKPTPRSRAAHHSPSQSRRRSSRPSTARRKPRATSRYVPQQF